MADLMVTFFALLGGATAVFVAVQAWQLKGRAAERALLLALVRWAWRRWFRAKAFAVALDAFSQKYIVEVASPVPESNTEKLLADAAARTKEMAHAG